MILQVKDLAVDYRIPGAVIHAVRGVSFEIDKGEILGLIGESGCGKSTLGYTIPRLLPPAGRVVSGQVIVDGVDIMALPESELHTVRGRKITYVPQGAQNALNPLFSVEHQIADPIRHHKKIGWKEALERTRTSLGLVGIPEERGSQYPHQYSGGMKQRSLIAMSLALNSELVVLDEPTTALDVVVQKQIFGLVKDIRKQFETAFLLISHDLAIIATVCDRIAIMYAGKIVEVAMTKEIFAHPKHPYTKALIASLPRIHFSDETLEPIQGSPPNLISLPPGCAFSPRCKYSIDRCTREVPALEEVGNGHLSACFRALQV